MTIEDELAQVRRALHLPAQHPTVTVSRPLASYLLAQVRYVERLALCPDHRDKTSGRCVACDGERRGREEERSRRGGDA